MIYPGTGIKEDTKIRQERKFKLAKQKIERKVNAILMLIGDADVNAKQFKKLRQYCKDLINESL